MITLTRLTRASKVMLGTRSVYRYSSGPGVELVGGWVRPLGVERGRNSPCVVIAHPRGKDLEEARILHICNIANLCSLSVFRFNYRGHGRSKGDATREGLAERSDAVASVKEVLKFFPSVILLGLEYGAMIFGSLLRDSMLVGKLSGVGLISYPIDRIHMYSPTHYRSFLQELRSFSDDTRRQQGRHPQPPLSHPHGRDIDGSGSSGGTLKWWDGSEHKPNRLLFLHCQSDVDEWHQALHGKKEDGALMDNPPPPPPPLQLCDGTGRVSPATLPSSTTVLADSKGFPIPNCCSGLLEAFYGPPCLNRRCCFIRGSLDSDVQREELSTVLGPWLASCAGTIYDTRRSLLGFRP